MIHKISSRSLNMNHNYTRIKDVTWKKKLAKEHIKKKKFWFINSLCDNQCELFNWHRFIIRCVEPSKIIIICCYPEDFSIGIRSRDDANVLRRYELNVIISNQPCVRIASKWHSLVAHTYIYIYANALAMFRIIY